MSDEILWKKDEFLIHEKQDSTQMYYLKEGVMSVYKIKGDHEVQIGTIKAGELVGEMSFSEVYNF